jgi:hypothetical protein
MGNGPCDGGSSDGYNFGVGHFDKVAGTGFKSNDRCNDVGYEWVGSYVANFLTRF